MKYERIDEYTIRAEDGSRFISLRHFLAGTEKINEALEEYVAHFSGKTALEHIRLRFCLAMLHTVFSQGIKHILLHEQGFYAGEAYDQKHKMGVFAPQPARLFEDEHREQ